MKVIYYIVSGGNMEILQNLLTNLLGENLKAFTPLLQTLINNGFDLKKTLSSMDITALIPLVEQLFSATQNMKSPTQNVGQCSGVNPIIKFADKDIVYTLNKHLCD
jgi:hypothetical protein